MLKSVINNLTMTIAPLINSHLFKVILLIGVLLVSLLVPQVVFAGPSVGGA